MTNADSSLADEFNNLYVSFESSSHQAIIPSGEDGTALIMTGHNVRRTLRQVNVWKVAGPDRITECVLRSCANQLAPVFTSIFSLSLTQCSILTCLQQFIIVPAPKKP